MLSLPKHLYLDTNSIERITSEVKMLRYAQHDRSLFLIYLIAYTGLLNNAELAGQALVAVAHLQVINAGREAAQVQPIGVVVAG